MFRYLSNVFSGRIARYTGKLGTPMHGLSLQIQSAAVLRVHKRWMVITLVVAHGFVEGLFYRLHESSTTPPIYADGSTHTSWYEVFLAIEREIDEAGMESILKLYIVAHLAYFLTFEREFDLPWSCTGTGTVRERFVRGVTDVMTLSNEDLVFLEHLQGRMETNLPGAFLDVFHETFRRGVGIDSRDPNQDHAPGFAGLEFASVFQAAMGAYTMELVEADVDESLLSAP